MTASRRSFIRTAAIATGGCIAAPLVRVAASRSFAARGPRFTATRGLFTPIRRGVGTYEDRGGTIGWLATPSALLVVDSQFADTAAACRAGLMERAGRPVDFLLNTHHHGDHTSGNGVFAAEATIVAHRNVPLLQREAASRRPDAQPPVVAGVTFEEDWATDASDERVEMRHYGPGHTGGDAVVHFERADIVHMGDLVFNRIPPFIDIAGGASVAGWIGLLERVHADHTDDTVFIHGHANPSHGIVGTREDLLVMRDFLTALVEFVDRGLANGTPPDSLAATRMLPGFESHYAADRPDGLTRSIRAVLEERSRGR